MKKIKAQQGKCAQKNLQQNPSPELVMCTTSGGCTSKGAGVYNQQEGGVRISKALFIYLRTYLFAHLFFGVLIFWRTYFLAHLFCCTLILLCTYFAVDLLVPRCDLIFLYAYPAVPLFFCALTLLCPYFTFTYPAVPLFFAHFILLQNLTRNLKKKFARF